MPYFFQNLEKIAQKLSSAAFVIGALRVKFFLCLYIDNHFIPENIRIRNMGA